MDRNFDALAGRLKKVIYGSAKGKLRIELLWEDITHQLSGQQPLQVLDAGGGFGQISLKLARQGHAIVLCDISEKMLDEAAEAFEKEGLSSRLTIVHSPFQALDETYCGTFDLVLSHAVLEWLAKPEDSLKRLLYYLKPDGLISLMFYNLNSLIYQNAIKGNFNKIMSESFRGDANGLTPMNPQNPEQVEELLEGEGVTLLSKTGIRVFYDYIPRPVRRERRFEDVNALERTYCRKEPYASLGRYIHLMGIIKKITGEKNE